MRIRKITRELCYTAEEFKQLDASAICRRMNLGDEWVDAEQNKAAQGEWEKDVL